MLTPCVEAGLAARSLPASCHHLLQLEPLRPRVPEGDTAETFQAPESAPSLEQQATGPTSSHLLQCSLPRSS